MVAGRVGMTVSEVGDRMSAAELTEWIAFLMMENGNEIVRGGRDSL